MTGAAVPITLIALGPLAGVLVSALAARKCREERRFGSEITRPSGNDGSNRGGSSALPRHNAIPAAAVGLMLAAAAVVSGQSDAERALGALFLILLMGLFQSDRGCMRLPDVLTAPLFVVGLGLGWLSDGFWPALSAATLGTGILWVVATIYELLRRRPGLGRGDVKMMAGLSAAVGIDAIPWIILLSASLGLVAALRQGVVTSQSSLQQVIPFGCALAMAGGAIWLLT